MRQSDSEKNDICKMEDFIMYPQGEIEEFEDYEFLNTFELFTKNFLLVFQDDVWLVTHLAKTMIAEKYSDTRCGHIQKFCFKGIEFYAASNCSRQGEIFQSNWCFANVTFLLASEY